MGLLDNWNKPSKSVDSIVKEAAENNLNLLIKYRKFDGTVSERRLENVSYNNSYQERGYHNDHIEGFCTLRGEERVFKINRIISADIVE